VVVWNVVSDVLQFLKTDMHMRNLTREDYTCGHLPVSHSISGRTNTRLNPSAGAGGAGLSWLNLSRLLLCVGLLFALFVPFAQHGQRRLGNERDELFLQMRVPPYEDVEVLTNTAPRAMSRDVPANKEGPLETAFTVAPAAHPTFLPRRITNPTSLTSALTTKAKRQSEAEEIVFKDLELELEMESDRLEPADEGAETVAASGEEEQVKGGVQIPPRETTLNMDRDPTEIELNPDAWDKSRVHLMPRLKHNNTVDLMLARQRHAESSAPKPSPVEPHKQTQSPTQNTMKDKRMLEQWGAFVNYMDPELKQVVLRTHGDADPASNRSNTSLSDVNEEVVSAAVENIQAMVSGFELEHSQEMPQLREMLPIIARQVSRGVTQNTSSISDVEEVEHTEILPDSRPREGLPVLEKLRGVQQERTIPSLRRGTPFLHQAGSSRGRVERAHPLSGHSGTAGLPRHSSRPVVDTKGKRVDIDELKAMQKTMLKMMQMMMKDNMGGKEQASPTRRFNFLADSGFVQPQDNEGG